MDRLPFHALVRRSTFVSDEHIPFAAARGDAPAWPTQAKRVLSSS